MPEQSNAFYKIQQNSEHKNLTFNQKASGMLGFAGGAVVKNPPANAGDTGSIPGLGRSHMPRSS